MCRPGIEPRNRTLGADIVEMSGRQYWDASPTREAFEPHGVEDPEHAQKQLAREPGDPVLARPDKRIGTCQEVHGRELTMNGHGKSDRPVVPAKFPNNISTAMAEEMEGRGLAKGNLSQQNTNRTQDRGNVSSALERVRQAAKRDRKLKFTSLLHHIYNPVMLRESFEGLKKKASPGVDGETWTHYGENLERNLQDLSERLKRGGYRAKPVKRAYILKSDGRRRPLGVTALEDKIVQRATVLVLSAIYEVDFLGFSYGFREGRGQHDALDALYVALLTRKVNWVIDADLRAFFDSIDREWLVKFLEHRIADKRVVHLIQKWLNAGVLEDGEWSLSEEGTPQGASVSPLLANVVLHYVLDLWAHHWRRTQAKGDVILVRWADDFVVGFQYRWEAERFLEELKERFQKFKLELHPEKTRLLEFGPYATENRGKRGEGKPETFDFLGFTHICGTKRSNGKFTVIRKTINKRLRKKLQEVKDELRRRMHEATPDVGKWLRSVVNGHNRYYGVPLNQPAMRTFRSQIGRLWHHSLRRRSQKTRVNWERMKRLIRQWLPPVHVYHPYPLRRMGVIT
jgi:RNA-directed DNA polymerase